MPVLTPKGPALAHFLIDYGEEHHLMWVCVLDKTGEIWTFANPDIRGQVNQTFKRNHVTSTYDGLTDASKFNAATNGDLDRQC